MMLWVRWVRHQLLRPVFWVLYEHARREQELKRRRCKANGGHFLDRKMGVQVTDFQRPYDQDVYVSIVAARCAGCDDHVYSSAVVTAAEAHAAHYARGLFEAYVEASLIQVRAEFPSYEIGGFRGWVSPSAERPSNR